MSEEAKSPDPKTKEALKETPSPSLPPFKFATWGEVIDIFSKTILVLFGSAYIVGLLILNFHIRKYGLYYLGFLQIEYVMVGLLWGFLVGSIYLFVYYLRHQIKQAYRQDGSGRLKIFARTINVLLTTVGGLAILYYILNVASESELDYRTRTPYTILLFLILNAAALFNISQEVRQVVRRFAVNDDKDARLYIRARYFFISYNLIILLVMLSAYTKYVFPALSPVFGGGKKQKAEFIIKADQVETVNLLGFQVNNRSIGPLEVIFEGADFFAVAPPEGVAKNNVKAIRIRRDIVDAALYLSDKKE